MKVSPLLVFALTLTAVAAPDPNWPQFRGPESNPVGTDQRLPDKWSKTESVEWSTEIPGRGWSSPIVAGGKVFLTTVTTDGQSKAPQTGTEYSNEYIAELMKKGMKIQEAIAKVTERDFEMPNEVMLHYFLYCLDLKTGAVSWKKEFFAGHPPGGRHRKNSFASETPITDGKLVYVYVGNLGLYAFDLKGKQVWKSGMEAFPIYLDFGTGGSAVMQGNQLIIVNDNQKQQFIAAFDKRTGKELWRTNRDIGDKRDANPDRPVMRSGWSTPFIWTTNIRTEIVTVGPGTAISYDLEGKELWRLSGMALTPVPSPFSYQGLLYIDAGRGRPLFGIKPGASGDITLGKDEKSNEFVAWSEARGGTYLPTPVAYNGALYILNETGILTRLDAKNGKQTYKTRLDPNAGNFTSSPWAYNGKVFFLNEEGKTFVIPADEKFELLHVNSLDEFTMTTPAIVGDRLLLRTQSRLYSIRSK
jgi:outer membrane protein assembly factor BamB